MGSMTQPAGRCSAADGPMPLTCIEAPVVRTYADGTDRYLPMLAQSETGSIAGGGCPGFSACLLLASTDGDKATEFELVRTQWISSMQPMHQML